MAETLFDVVLPPRQPFSVPIQIVRRHGVVAWLLEDHSIPVISIAWSWPGGAAFDPPGQEGLASVAFRLLTEGAGDLRAAAFSNALRDIGASLEIDAGRDTAKGIIRALKDALPSALRLAHLSMTQPRLDEDAIERVLAQSVAAARRSLENPATRARHAFWKTAFPTHSVGRMATPETLSALTGADLSRFLLQHVLGAGIQVGVSGAITVTETESALGILFDGLPNLANPQVDPLPPMVSFDWISIAASGPQSTIVFGHDAFSPDDPDWEAAQVAMRVLGGGGLTSRLMEKVRYRRGLTYGIGAGLNVFARSAIVQGSVATSNATAGEVWSLVRTAWQEMAENGPTAEEMTEAVSFFLGSLPLQFADSRGSAQTLLSLQQLGRSPDWLARRPARLAALTRDEVARVARRLLQPDSLRLVVAGAPQGIPGL